MAQRKRIPGRKRRVAGWMLLTLGLLVAAVWVASGLGTWSRYTASGDFFCSRGRLTWVLRSTPGAGNGGKVFTAFSRFVRPDVLSGEVPTPDVVHIVTGWNLGLVTYHKSSLIPTAGVFSSTTIRVGLLPLSALLLTPAALLLRSGIVARRRAQSGKCKACGYDLAGLPPLLPAADARCPECGKQQTSHG